MSQYKQLRVQMMTIWRNFHYHSRSFITFGYIDFSIQYYIIIHMLKMSYLVHNLGQLIW